MLAQFTKNGKDTNHYQKAPLLTLTNNIFVLWCSGCLSTIVHHLFTEKEVSAIKRRKDFLTEYK